MSLLAIIGITIVCCLAIVGAFTIVILMISSAKYPKVPSDPQYIDDFEKMADKGEKK